MPEFTIYYRVTLEGQYVLQAASEEAACEAFDDLSVADLVAEADHCNADRTIDDVSTDASPLEQLAEQAE